MPLRKFSTSLTLVSMLAMGCVTNSTYNTKVAELASARESADKLQAALTTTTQQRDELRSK